jgi:uncharacterized Fe-S cluster-containing radical SAM superfamily enzyme
MQIHSIELTNYCNLKCGYCPNATATYPKGFLDEENYLRALKYVVDGVGVGISGCGESLLHPNLVYFVKLAVERGITPGLNTNGLLLTPELACKLVNAGLKKIEISIHTKESYEAYKMMTELHIPMEITANVLTINKDKAIEWRGMDKLPLRVQSTHNWALDGGCSQKSPCVFIQRDWCMMKWDGWLVPCCFDFNGERIGEVRHMAIHKHFKKGYKLCKTCSPAWVTGQNDTWWVI